MRGKNKLNKTRQVQGQMAKAHIRRKDKYAKSNLITEFGVGFTLSVRRLTYLVNFEIDIQEGEEENVSVNFELDFEQAESLLELLEKGRAQKYEINHDTFFEIDIVNNEYRFNWHGMKTSSIWNDYWANSSLALDKVRPFLIEALS